MRIILSLFIVFFLFGCQSQYFEFDEAIHYKLKSDMEGKIFEALDNKNGELESFANQDFPNTISDSTFFSKLENYYTAETIDKPDNLASIYSDKVSVINMETKCEPIYRDILIFKRHNKVVGISKICFECLKSYTITSNGNVEAPKTSGDFERLTEILN